MSSKYPSCSRTAYAYEPILHIFLEHSSFSSHWATLDPRNNQCGSNISSSFILRRALSLPRQKTRNVLSTSPAIPTVATAIFCAKRPATWTDIMVFYLGNYVAHAATVNIDPGQPILSSVLAVILVILFPGTGIEKALLAIYSRAVLPPTELQQAARAGALCVVRKRDTSAASSAADSTSTTEEEEQAKPTKNPISLVSEKLHGICELPEGYYLATLPQDATFEDDPSPGERQSLHWTERGLVGPIKPLFIPRPRRNHISCSYNLVKIAASAAQLLFACATLYRIRGDQIERFGYAAFSLTVAQYAWMSFLSLLGNAMRPGYPTKVLVGSDSLDNLRALLRRQCQESEYPISGSVGRISRETEARLSAMPKACPQRRKISLVVKLIELVWRKSLPRRWRRSVN